MVVLTQNELNEKLALVRAMEQALGTSDVSSEFVLELRNNCHPTKRLTLWYVAPTLVIRCGACGAELMAIQVAAGPEDGGGTYGD
jgi:ribosomal protein S27E